MFIFTHSSSSAGSGQSSKWQCSSSGSISGSEERSSTLRMPSKMRSRASSGPKRLLILLLILSCSKMQSLSPNKLCLNLHMHLMLFTMGVPQQLMKVVCIWIQLQMEGGGRWVCAVLTDLCLWNVHSCIFHLFFKTYLSELLNRGLCQILFTFFWVKQEWLTEAIIFGMC